MNVLLTEPILERMSLRLTGEGKIGSAKEVATLLLKLRKEILDCLK
jgi:hypothetical protein